MNRLGAPASRRPVGCLKLEHAGETPALPCIVPRFRGSKREILFRGILTPALSSLGGGEVEKMVRVSRCTRRHLASNVSNSGRRVAARLKRSACNSQYPVFIFMPNPRKCHIFM